MANFIELSRRDVSKVQTWSSLVNLQNDVIISSDPEKKMKDDIKRAKKMV